MNAQIFPGGGKRFAHSFEKNFDDPESRKVYFEICLKLISQIPNLESIAFPYMIGCGLARGDWSSYLKMLENFESEVCKTQCAEVIMCKI